MPNYVVDVCRAVARLPSDCRLGEIWVVRINYYGRIGWGVFMVDFNGYQLVISLILGTATIGMTLLLGVPYILCCAPGFLFLGGFLSALGSMGFFFFTNKVRLKTTKNQLDNIGDI